MCHHCQLPTANGLQKMIKKSKSNSTPGVDEILQWFCKDRTILKEYGKKGKPTDPPNLKTIAY